MTTKWIIAVSEHVLPERVEPLYNSLTHYCPHIKIHMCGPAKVLPLSKRLSSSDTLIMISTTHHEDTYAQIRVKLPKSWRERIVLLGIDDVSLCRHPEAKKAQVPIIDICGSENVKTTIPGYGFLPFPQVRELATLVNQPWADRSDALNFRGSFNGNTRANFLRQFKSLGMETHFVCFPSKHDGGKLDMAAVYGAYDDVLPRGQHHNYSDYLKEMVQHKVCLAPFGYGHTHRFLEGMAMGCLVVTESIQHLKFSVNPFVVGENYLETGWKFENMEEVMKVIKDDSEASRIAKNGRDVYEEHFSRGYQHQIPLKTLRPMLAKLEDKFGQFFLSKIRHL